MAARRVFRYFRRGSNMTAAAKERQRCLAIIDKHLPYAESLDEDRGQADPGAGALLIRIRNQIANGNDPTEFGEQMLQMLDDLRATD